MLRNLFLTSQYTFPVAIKGPYTPYQEVNFRLIHRMMIIRCVLRYFIHMFFVYNYQSMSKLSARNYPEFPRRFIWSYLYFHAPFKPFRFINSSITTPSIAFR